MFEWFVRLLVRLDERTGFLVVWSWLSACFCVMCNCETGAWIDSLCWQIKYRFGRNSAQTNTRAHAGHTVLADLARGALNQIRCSRVRVVKKCIAFENAIMMRMTLMMRVCIVVRRLHTLLGLSCSACKIFTMPLRI